ncbi:MAG: hypothetical protein IKR76_06020 [Ruminococcus sp.]|nr:hypothetical protein [Ruminococcus sp.]
MKKTTLILSFILTLTLCACSDNGSDSDKPVATSAPDVTVSSQAESSSENDSSSEEESSYPDESSMSDAEYQQLANLSEDFETTEDFLSSGFIEKYYADRNTDGINYIPEHDEEVIEGGVTAYYGCYYIYYTYKDKSMAVCVDMASGKYGSTEDIYNETYKRLSNTLSDNKEETLSHCKYDKENDIMIYDEKADNITGYISLLNNIGYRVEIVCYDMDSTVDDIIEFSKHLKF